MTHATLLQRLEHARFFQGDTGGAGGAADNTDWSISEAAPSTSPEASPEATEQATTPPYSLPGLGNMVRETVAPTQTPVVEPQPQENGATGWLIAGGLLLVVVALLAVVAVLLRRKPKSMPVWEGSAPDGAQEPITAVEDSTARMEPVTLQMAPPTLQVGHAQHIGRRSDQQDSYGFSSVVDAPNKGLLAVVADGMGGLSDGAAISQTAVQTIIGGFQSLAVEQNPPLQMMRLAGAAHNAVCAMPSFGQGGSTLLMVYVWDSWMFTLSIGDSRIYLMRDHTLMQLNREHTYAVELDERAGLGEISIEQALNDPQRKALTSYLGIEELQKIDRTLRPFPLRRGDRIALMSDGVFGTISDGELQVLLELPAQEAAQQIQEAVLLKNMPRQDNLTVVVIAYE